MIDEKYFDAAYAEFWGIMHDANLYDKDKIGEYAWREWRKVSKQYRLWWIKYFENYRSSASTVRKDNG